MVSPIKKYPEVPGEFSSLSITEFNEAIRTVCVSKEEEYDLRFARTEDLLSKVKTLLLRPDRGVSLEFNLTDKQDLWEELLTVFDKYSEIVPTVKYLLQFSTIPSSYYDSDTVLPNNTWVIEYITSASSRFTGLGLGASEDIKEAVQDFISEADKAMKEVRQFTDAIDYTRTMQILAAALDKDNSLSATSFRNIASVKQNIRRLSAEDSEDLTEQTLKMIWAFIEALNTFTEGLSDMADEDLSPKLAVLRLFPVAAAVIPALPQITTIRQSYRKYIQTAVPAPNIAVQLRNNTAFNTLDTQWVTFYLEVLDLIFKYRNPKFTLRCGTYRIQDCNISESVNIGDTGASVESFNMEIISERTGLDLETL